MVRSLAVAASLALLVGLAALRPADPAAAAPAFEDAPPSALEAEFSAGRFLEQTPEPNEAALYRDSIASVYSLTSGEQSLLSRHGFVVTERVHPPSFGDGLLDVYVNDLPVFVSTDAVLHAVHMSYDGILASTEAVVLLPLLEGALASMHSQIRPLASTSRAPGMDRSLADLDVYLTVARSLLSENPVSPVLTQNASLVGTILGHVEDAGGAVDLPLFSESCRSVDFSQFTPRGHYTDSPTLTRYFQTMIWLGRTEIYLSAPQTDACAPTDADVRRQAVVAHLILEAAEQSGARADLDEIEALLSLFVGPSDNVTMDGLERLADEAGVERAADLLEDDVWSAYQAALEAAPWSRQRIRSQILTNSPGGVDRAAPAAAFLLMGQRFTLDGYVTSEVVYDALEHDGEPVRRMMPSTLDVLFALGNDAAAQLLRPEFERYPYASTLENLRRLIDGTEDEVWQGSLYNGWLGAIRAMNPPPETERAALPGFMQTAAWWQQKMNTQLASWAQLRHDNLLYAKPSYTVVPGCSFPYSYVEPEPDLFRAVAGFARTARDGFEPYATANKWDTVTRVRDYFGRLATITDTLATIAQKELDGERPDGGEQAFLSQMVFEDIDGCVLTLNGWYTDLYYGGATQAKETDLVVADIHTSPADEEGNPVGWVLHAGTGPLDLAVVTAEVPGVGPVAFTGPVLSYREHVTTDFQRLTDESWEMSGLEAASRPPFTRLYLADASGQAQRPGPMLDR